VPFKNGNNPANKKILDEQEVLDLYASGESTNKIAERLGCHKSIISRIVKKHGALRFRRLTPEEQAQAVALYQQGFSGPVIAEELGVCAPAVYLALRKSGIERRSVSDYDYEEGTIRHSFFDQIDEPQKAYWLGMLLTDGCVFGNEIILSLGGKDAHHVELWRKTIGSQAKLSQSIKPKTFGQYDWSCSTARLTIRSRQLTAALAKLGVVPAKTGRTTYPAIPEPLAPHFWRGAVDGDGWLAWANSGERRQLTLGITGDLPFVEAFQAFCQKHTPTRARIQPNGSKVYKFVVSDWFAFDIAKLLYRDAQVALPRKQRIYREACDEFERKQRQIRNWSGSSDPVPA
jgi:Helix-turn-helix domain